MELEDGDQYATGTGRPPPATAQGYGATGGYGGAIGGGAAPGIIGGIASSGVIVGGGDTAAAGFIQAGVSNPTNPPTPKRRLLCKTAGCSFYAIEKLENFCSNCYEDYYGMKLEDGDQYATGTGRPPSATAQGYGATGGYGGAIGGGAAPGIIGGIASSGVIVGGGGTAGAGFIQVGVSNPTNPPAPRKKVLCKTAGCSFYGKEAWENFCSNCYEDYYGMTPEQANPPTLKMRMLCKTAGCSYYAVEKLENFCSNCYEDYYGMKAPPQSSTLDKVVPQYANQPAQPQYRNPYESLDHFQKNAPPPPQPQGTKDDPLPVPPPRSTASTLDKNKCQTLSCDFFGTAETRYYCSKCFERQMDAIVKRVEPKYITQDSEPPSWEKLQKRPTPQNPQEKCDQSIEALMKRLEDTESEIKRLKNESHTQVLEVEQQKRQLSQALKAAEDKISNVQRLATYEYQLLQHRMTELELSFQSASQKSPNQPFWVVPRSDIVLTEEEVGRGGWGTINVALFRGQRVAAKSLHNEIISPHNIRLFTREMNVMAQVRHPNIILFIGATNEGVPVVLTELMAQSLRDLLTRGNVANPLLISIASDVTRALNYLHLNQPRPLIHRDMSSANVLLNPMPDSMWTAKVSDFGSTNFLNQTQTTGPGNPVYAAPESYNPLQHTPKMDVFSFGVLLIEMCSCQLPPVEEREELIRAINWPECEKLIRDCLKHEPSKRPSMGEVLVGLGMM